MKEELLVLFQDYLTAKIQRIRNQIRELSDESRNDAKSSAGDKHETSLSMMHLEQEKLNQNLQELVNQQVFLQKEHKRLLDQTHVVSLGSLVYFGEHCFYISLSLPLFVVGGISVQPVSLQSPLAKQLSGKKKGDTVVFLNQAFEIEKIL